MVDRHSTPSDNASAAEAKTISSPTSNGKLNPLSKESLVLYVLIVVASLCSFSGGYDVSVMTGLIGMIPFIETFNPENSPHVTGIIFSVYPIGQLVGSLVASMICDKRGRRSAMFIGSIMVIVSTTILITSNTYGQFLAGRFLLGAGVAFTDVSGPTYCVEIAPTQWRGRMTAFYNIGGLFGYVVAAAMVWGTSTITNAWSWKIPLFIQFAPASIVMSVIWFCPESPRWLFVHGKEDQAYQILVRYHGNNNPNDETVALEMSEFRSKIHIDDSNKSWWDFTPLFKTRNARWRSLMVIMMAFFVQFSGAGLASYILQIYQAVGFDSRMQFGLNLLGICIGAITAMISAALADKLHRRTLLVYGTIGSAIFLAMNAGFSGKWASYGDGPKDQRVANAAIAGLFIFSAIYSFTYAPLQSLYCVECLETTTRAKGMTLKTYIINLSSFINLYSIPIGLAKLQWRLILVFVFVDLIEAILWYFLCIETVGKTLEELDDIFNERNPVKASQFRRKLTVSEK